jgi:hypothetical protein
MGIADDWSDYLDGVYDLDGDASGASGINAVEDAVDYAKTTAGTVASGAKDTVDTALEELGNTSEAAAEAAKRAAEAAAIGFGTYAILGVVAGLVLWKSGALNASGRALVKVI